MEWPWIGQRNVLGSCEKLMQTVCAFLCWTTVILHLQRLGLGRVWAGPAGHQFCRHIHLHLGHQVRISMFLHCREIARLLSIISRFQGEARTDGCCSSAVLAGAPSASHSLKADLCSPTFKTVQRQRWAAEWYSYAAVVLLIGKSTDWLSSCPIQIFSQELFLEAKGVPQPVWIFLLEWTSTILWSCSRFPTNSVIVADSPSVVGRVGVLFRNLFLFVPSLTSRCFLSWVISG